MAGIKALRYIQIGKEGATPGTSTAATTIWRGTGTIEDRSTFAYPDEDVGYIAKVNRVYVPKKEAAISFDAVEATFEQLPYIFEAGVKLQTTGAADSTGSGKVYTYTFPTTAAVTPQTFTIEGGDDTQEEEMEGAFVEKFMLSGKAGEGWKIQADWVGKQITASTKTGALAPIAVEEILFSQTTLWIDGTTIGTTTAASTLLAADFGGTTGLKPLYTADAVTMNTNSMDRPDLTLKLTFLHNSTAVAEKAAWRAKTTRFIRLQSIGTALTTAGNFTNKTLRIDACGVWDKFDKIGEQDGNDIVTGTLKIGCGLTGALSAEVKIVNQTAVLP